jgi:hypothetical protein
MKKQAGARKINITIRLQWNPKAAKDAAAKLRR